LSTCRLHNRSHCIHIIFPKYSTIPDVLTISSKYSIQFDMSNILAALLPHILNVFRSPRLLSLTNLCNLCLRIRVFYRNVVISGDPDTYELQPSLVRGHLSEMMRQQQVTPFPYQVHCYCQMPSRGRMVACDGCDGWFHAICLSGRKRLGKGKWYCRRCH